MGRKHSQNLKWEVEYDESRVEKCGNKGGTGEN